MNIDTVIIDEKEYYIVDKVNMNNNTYYYLVAVLDKTDIMIRKYVVKDGQEYLVGLDDEVEFNKVLETYLKDKGLLNN